MAIIPDSLSEQILKNPLRDYPVLITLRDETLPLSLSDKGKFIMGNKILSATLSGNEIQNLKTETEIEAIEPNEEMGIL